MRSLFCMILTFALTLALSLPGRAQTPPAGSCVNVSVNVNVEVEVNVSVQVVVGDDGGVNLAWETGTEPDTAGFNIYRANPEGSYDKLNGALLPARPDPGDGSCHYFFADGPDNGTSPYYMLESMGIDGKRKHRALVSVSRP